MYFHIFIIIVINFLIIILMIIIIFTISAIITIVFCYLFIYYYYFFFLFFSYTSCQQVNSLCIILVYNGGSKAPIRLSRRRSSCLVYTKLGMFGQAQCRRRYILPYSTQFLIRIRYVPGNVVMVATDIYGKSPPRSGYTELRESMTFISFLFSFLIIKSFYNF